MDGKGRCTNAFKILSRPDVLQAAYEKLKSKPGMMTPGVDRTTLDGISRVWFYEASEQLIKECYKFKPVRRILIPKANGKTRPLGIGTPKDRIIQQAMKMVIEAILEPKFLESSHGFRPMRGCHTALKELREWKGVS